jgi:hypothetical protein
MKKAFLSLSGSSVMLFILLALRPIPVIPEGECKVTSGIVTEIFEGGEKDIVFHLQGDARDFYINRGLEKGLDLMELKKNLKGNEVTFKYPEHWTPLDPTQRMVHLVKIEFHGKTLYAEID